MILIVAPWSSYWEDRNAIASMLPGVRAYLSNPFVRGAATGVGIITACAGLAELAGALGLRRVAQGADISPPK